ncbi:MAG TPA: NFACT RNA binding domain-containing protein [Oscillospiraceae bacterium]|nr:NFACT RNA binding domain-containing protein [Oscillospiraceae bacterium]
MALDGAFLYCLRMELQGLIGARVDKIYQPSRDELILSLRVQRTGMESMSLQSSAARLLLSANAMSARASLTEVEFENPKQPSMLCMLLRKHIGGARLTAIRQEGLERILFIDFECLNELGDFVTVTIVCEIMGRHSNVIVVGENGRIIDSIKRVDEEMSSVRRVLPGALYELPPRQDRLNLLECDEMQIRQALDSARNDKLHKSIIGIFEGISPIFARECALYSARDVDVAKDELTEDNKQRLIFYLKQAKEQILNKPKYTLVAERDGKPRDFCFVDVVQYGTAMIKSNFDSASKLLEQFYSQRDRVDRMRQRSQDLLKLLVNATERVRHRIESQRIDLEKCGERDKLKIFGDLINANIYRLESGQKQASLENFYDSGEVVNIQLDPRLSPAQNAQRYYSEYRKANTAQKKLTELIAQGEQELIYLDSVFDALTRTQGESELLEIREELAEQGYLKRSKKTSKMLRAQPPMKYTSSDGFTILVGRNNKQNDRLTTKDAHSTDIWLHTHNIPGSHVIIVTQGENPPDSTIMEAAMLAALHSKAYNSAKVPVDYTQVKFVKKPNGAKPGMVIFTNNKTVYTTPDEEKAKSLK